MNRKEILLEDFLDKLDYSYYDQTLNEVEHFYEFCKGELSQIECCEILQQHYSNKYDNMLECNQ